MKKVHGIFFIIFVLAVFVRLYKIDGPVADWHSWRQADTAAVARNFIRIGIDPLRPRFDDLSNIPSGKENPEGYRMVEFPLYQLVSVGFYKLTRELFSIEVWLRIINIFASSLTAVLLGLITTKLVNKGTGIIGGFLYAVLPYSVFYGRSILPDTFMVFWAMLSAYLIVMLHSKNGLHYWLFFVLASVSASIALLVKPVAIFLLLPTILLFFSSYKHAVRSILSVLLYSTIILVPIYLWRNWINNFPTGIPVFAWLFNEGNIRFKGAWFYWLFAERIANLILGYWGVVFLTIGIALKTLKGQAWLFPLWLLSTVLYFVIIARGNVQHDYYQILALPIICFYVAHGIYFFLTAPVFSLFSRMMLTITLFAFMLAFSWYTVRSYYWINHPEIVAVGRQADNMLPKEAKVIAPYNGDTTFLYQIRRQGWPIGFDIEKKIANGATHYVTLSPTDSDFETKELAERFTVIIRNDQYAIIDLTQPKKAK